MAASSPIPVLVTGGAGFIGSHACKALRLAGFLPVSFDNLTTGHSDAVRWGPLILGDVRDPQALAQAFETFGIVAVIHFAASAYVGESVLDPARYYDNNVGGMINLLASSRAAGVKEIVFSSTCATYGVPHRQPINEATPQHPVNPYGRTKLICEEMLRDYETAYGLRHVALRYFNAAGADPEGELSERHAPETHLIPLALRAATGQHPALSILGTDYDTADGTCVRDYVHVVDLAQAHVKAMQYLRSGRQSIALNLGTGRGTSVREVVAAVSRNTGRRPKVIEAARRAGDPPELVADPSLARTLLGFSAALSDIDTIVRHAAPSFGLEVIDAVFA